MRKLNFEFTKLLFVTLCYCLAQNCVNNVLAVYLDSLGYGAATAGYMSVAYAIFAILARLAAGFFADSISRRVVLSAGCLVFAISSLLFGIAPLIGLLILFRGFQGGGYSAVNTASSTVCVDLAPENSLSRYMSFFWGANAVSLAITGFITQYYISSGQYKGTFFTVAAVLFAAFIVSLSMSYEKGLPTRAIKKKPGFKEIMSGILEKKALPAFAVLLLLAASHSSVGIYILVYANRVGIDKIAGIYSLTAALAMVLANIITPRIIKRVGYLIPLVISSSFFGAALLCLSYRGILFSFVLAAFCFGFLIGMAFPILNTLAVKNLPYHRRGAGSGTVLLALDVGVGIGSFTCGNLIDSFGFSLMFFIAAILSFCSVILSIVLFRNIPGD